VYNIDSQNSTQYVLNPLKTFVFNHKIWVCLFKCALQKHDQYYQSTHSRM